MSTENQALIDAARASVTASGRITELRHPLDANIRIPVEVDGTGEVSIRADALDILDARYAARPRVGVATLTEVDSFIAHVWRWGSDTTVIYADTADLSLTAVLDDHPADPSTTAARQHRASYACPRSPAWLAWTAIDGTALSQTEFADFIDSHLEDLVDAPAEGMPKPLEVLAIARSLHVMTKGEFRRDVNVTNGDSTFICKTETDAKSTQIPRAFMLGLAVFDGGARYQVEARIRFALVGGARPTFTIVLHRRTEIERLAFSEVRARVATETGRLVLAGTP